MPGRAIVNSDQLRERAARRSMRCCRWYASGAAVVALTIDETGMAKTARAQARGRRAHPRHRHVGEYGLPPGALIFDALTFTLATGDADSSDSALETIEGIRAIKRELPGVLTSLGVSNVSFGLKPAARAALNSVFLHHCVEAGLDMAIVNAKEITPYAELDAASASSATISCSTAAPTRCQRLIEHFEAQRRGRLRRAMRADDDADAPIEPRIHNAILRRRKDGIEAKIDQVACSERDAGRRAQQRAVARDERGRR